MSGDLEQGRRAIQIVEEAGLSESIVRTLQGLLLIFDGELPEAVDALQLAVEEDPQAVPLPVVPGSLRITILAIGRWPRRQSRICQM